MSKKLLLPGFLFLCCITANSQRNTVTLYDQCNHSGISYRLGVGNYDLPYMKIENDKLASIRVPSGMKVTLYEHDKFMGQSVTYNYSVTCLPPNWFNTASSIVVENDYNQGNNSGNDYVTFYNDCFSQGYSQSLRPGSYSGAQLGILRNNISSFTINGNLRVKAYLNSDNLSGYSLIYDSNTDCLNTSQNDRFASLVIEYKSNQSTYPTNPTNPNSYATIYTDCNYRGNSLRLGPGTYSGDKLGLLKYDISSIEVPSNLRARVYLNDYLSGSFYLISQNTNCLSATLNNRIASISIEETSGGNNPYNPNNSTGGQRVVIYSDASYHGQSVSLQPGNYATMEEIGFLNDELSSLTVPAGYRVVLYEHVNFAGKTYTVTADKAIFTFSGWNDKASSLVVYKDY